MPKITVNKIATLQGHNDCIYTLSPGLNSSQVISGAGDGMVVVWDINNPKDGELVVQVPNSVYALHLIPNSVNLIVGQNFEGIHEIDLQTRKETRSLKLTTSEIFDIQSYDNRLIVATKTGEVLVVNKESFLVEKNIQASTVSARTIAIGKTDFAIGYSDNCIRIFDKKTLELTHSLLAHEISVFTLQYSPNGKYLISGSRDAHIKFWNTTTYQLEESVAAHMYAINHITFSDSGNYFFSCSMDKSIKIWDSETKKLLKVIDKARYAGHGTSINKLYWSSYYQYLIAASDDRTLTIWNIKFD